MKRPLLLAWFIFIFVLAGASACSSPAPVAPDGSLADLGPGKPDSAPATPDAFHGDGPGPMANVYKVSPTADNKQTSQVLLRGLTDPGGALVGKYASVWNCVNEPGGPPININLGGLSISGTVCKVTQKAQRGPDGSYLSIVPPAVDTDGGDAFAEVMMYHHVTTIGSYYRTQFGISHVEKSLRAMVNLQGHADVFNWVGFPNAAYFPQPDVAALEKLLGTPIMNGEEGIVFGYNNLVPGMPMVDYSYDASVIYHEYTHFTVGMERCYLPNPDQYGVDPTPLALHEGFADYMAASYLDNSKIGDYALGAMGRDLTRTFKCPDHVNGEEHNDGEIASGALWAVRTQLGAGVLDAALWKAIFTLTASSGFEQASTAILDQVKQVAPDKEAAVKQILIDHGMLGCVRLLDHKDFEVNPLLGVGEPKVLSSGEVEVSYPDGVPGGMQYRVALAEGTKEVTIEYAAQSSGMMGLPTGGPAELWVALRKGSAPITYTYDAGVGTSDAQKILKGDAVTGGGQKLVLTGSCISPGDLIFQFVNRGTEGAGVTKVKVTQSATVTQASNFDGC